MPKGIYERKGWKGNQTSFKKGHKPKNKGKGLYAICVCGKKIKTFKSRPKKYCCRKCYFENKEKGYGKGWIDEKGYKRFEQGREHRLVWEKAHGPIPIGMIIHHKDGDKMNNKIENLKMMTKGEHIKLHDYAGRKKQ